MQTDKDTKNTGKIRRVSGPLVEAEGLRAPQMYEVVKVGNEGLLGEIIALSKDFVSVQVYEDTAGISPGEPVHGTGETMSVELGPGLLESIYDGVERPLKLIEEKSGSFFIARGIEAEGISRAKKWLFKPKKKVGDNVVSGDVLGEVQETTLINHKIMVPPELSGVLKVIVPVKECTVEEVVAVLTDSYGQDHEIKMLSRWPIRKPRPKQEKIFPDTPLVTGIRVIDSFFPIAKGGVAAIPGPFGSGKTVAQQSIAKYCDAEVIVYVGCGERGNEMTEVLSEFPHLEDPNTGEPLLKRTILIANTSNMPVAAREASVYTAITIAEYYRDMGYSVALMADSTSRWAEAMREISGRMEEMPGEEGYPAYLSSRTAEFYERAGLVKCLGEGDRIGALTVIGAVSPPGGDLSEPVSQATLRVVKCFWGLDAGLAYKKHFPSINWLNSYSLYTVNIENSWRTNVAQDYPEVRAKAMNLLQDEAKLLEIVRLVGMESLSNEERLILEISKSIREDFLFQNAFDKEDAYTSPKKQYGILKSILSVFDAGKKAVSVEDFDFKNFLETKAVKELPSLKTFPADDLDKFGQFCERAEAEIAALK
ncbi:MAG: V-type ATP synthase subunit A [bacterium]|nr:V-type ATP synthase subunit A [bacterium]